MIVEWSHVFEEVMKEKGASEEELTGLVQSIGLPLSQEEINSINSSQHNPFPLSDPLYNLYRPFDPTKWVIPNRPLPRSYLDFLRWSNGGWGRSGRREFGFFGTLDLREFLLSYHVPQYMPGVIPFALDGGGIFYVFDMREEPVKEEYPILVVASGDLDFGDDKILANSFIEAYTGKTRASDVLHGNI